MSKTSFLAQMGIARMGKIGDSIISALVKFDPETASAAQIAEMEVHSNELAGRVAKAEQQVENDRHMVQQLTESLNRSRQAAMILGERLKLIADQNSEPASNLNTKLTTVLNEIEQVAGEDGSGASEGTLYDAQQHLVDSTTDLVEWKETHQNAVVQLTLARDRLRKAHAAMERAAEEQQRAEERRHQAERDAGLRQGLDTTNVALSAMEQATADARTAARAASIQTDALRKNDSGSADDIVAEALADQKPKSSALDRLAKLTR